MCVSSKRRRRRTRVPDVFSSEPPSRHPPSLLLLKRPATARPPHKPLSSVLCYRSIFFFLLRREERGRIGTVCLFVCFVSVCVLFYLGSFGRRHTLLVRKQRQLREFTVVNAAVQLFVEQSEVLVGTAQDPRFAIARDLQSDQRRALDRSVLVAHAPAAAILVQLDLFNNINTSTLEPNLG